MQASCVPVVKLGGQISFCQGNSIILNATNANSSYYWSTGATTPTITVSQSGVYWVNVANSCGTDRDTVLIVVDQPLNLNLGNPRPICSSGDTLSAPDIPGMTYLWSTGDTTSSIFINQAGNYKVTVINACGTFKDSVVLTSVNPPNPYIGPDIIKCDASPVNLSVNAPGSSISWSTGAQGNNIDVTSSGKYWVRLTNACGVYSDTINIKYSDGVSLDLGDTLGLCPGGTIVLDANAFGGAILWSTGAVSRTIQISQTGKYWVRYTDNCGVWSDTVEVVPTGNLTVDLGNDTSFCKGSSVLLDAQNKYSTYLWNTGDIKQTLVTNQPGTYWVRVDNGCGVVTDTIVLDTISYPKPGIKDLEGICRNGVRQMDAGDWGPETKYLWNNGDTTRYSDYTVPDSAWVLVTNRCASVLKKFKLVFVDPLVFDIGTDTILCADSLRLSTGLIKSDLIDISWSTNETEPSILVTGSGAYNVVATNACGSVSRSIMVEFLNPPREIEVDQISFCQGTPINLSMLFQSYTSYLWSTGDTSNSITVNTAGVYSVIALNACDTIRDTVTVKMDRPVNIDLGVDRVYCEPHVELLSLASESLLLDSLRWSNGSRNAVLPVTKTGMYWVEAWNSCGTFRDTVIIVINELPDRKLNDTNYCIGSSVVLNVKQKIPQTTYLWSTNSTDTSIIVSSPGWYWVDLTNSCGTIRDSVYVTEDNPLVNLDLGNDTVFCRGNILLDPGYMPGVSYRWFNNSRAQTQLITQSGTYYLDVTNACGKFSDTIEVLITGPPKVVLGTQVRFCEGIGFNLDAKNPGSTYKWNTGDSTQSIFIDTSGTYLVEIENDCGFLIDSVEVIVDERMDSLDLGVDTLICRGQSLTLRNPFPLATAQWQNGFNGDYIVVTESGRYWLRLENTCGVWSDTIDIIVEEIPVFDMRDTVLCALGGSVFLSGPDAMTSYLWSSGQGSAEATINQAGKYWLKVTNQCFSYTDTFYVNNEYPIDIDLGPDTSFCSGGSFTIQSNVTDYDVHWSNATIGQGRTVDKSGTYVAWAQNSCGIFSDTIEVQFHLDINPPDFDTTVCDGDTAYINLSRFPYSYEWFDGSTEKVKAFWQEGDYVLNITNKCGEYEKLFSVEYINCECPFFVADAFTPNGDNLNDFFDVGYDCDLFNYSIRIFDRWGQMIFNSNDVNDPWDGTRNGEDVPLGVYYFEINFDYKDHNLVRKSKHTGTLTLIR